MTIALTNTSGRMLVLVLEHGNYCLASGRCLCERRRDGVRLPSTLTLSAGVREAGLSDALLSLPQIQFGLRSGALRVEHTPPEPAPEVAVPQEGGPAGAPITPVEVPDERRAPVVQGRRR